MNAPVGMQGMVFNWLTSPAELDSIRDEWLALAQRVGADVFMRPDWLDVWWSHFGAGRQLVCGVARWSGVLVGIMPFAVETIRLGGLPQRIARLAGVDSNCIIFQLPLENAWAQQVLQGAMEHLINEIGCLAVSFTPVSDVAGYLSILQKLPVRNSRLSVMDEPAGTHTVFEFPARFEDFMARLTKKRRSQFRRDVTGLEEVFSMTSDHTVPDAAAFDDFIASHTEKWQAVGKGGHFLDWPGSADFYRDLAVRTTAAKLVQLDRLVGTDGELASEFSLVAGNTAHWRLPARRLDPDVERLSAGKVVFLRMFERMINEGITRIEGGRGDYGYKLEYGGQCVPVHRLIVCGSGNLVQLRIRILLGWADLLHLLYYRIWFLKLAPRLRKLTKGQSRPLWRPWIRTRL